MRRQPRPASTEALSLPVHAQRYASARDDVLRRLDPQEIIAFAWVHADLRLDSADQALIMAHIARLKSKAFSNSEKVVSCLWLEAHGVTPT